MTQPTDQDVADLQSEFSVPLAPPIAPPNPQPKPLKPILPEFVIVPPSDSDANMVEGKPAQYHQCLERVMAMPESISGEHGHDALFSVACEIARWAIPGGDAFEIISAYNDQRCTPPWPTADLKRKLKEGHKTSYKAGEIGMRLGEQKDRNDIDSQFEVIADAQPTVVEAVEPESEKEIPWTLNIAPEGFDSVFGRYAEDNDEYTEADKNVVLLSLKSMYGNVVGRRAYLTIDNDRHYAKIGLVKVGRTGRMGRKGTAYSNALAPLKSSFPDWVENCLSKYSSGEAVISKMRDPEEDDSDDEVMQQQPMQAMERRCLWYASEFVETLTHAKRDGSTSGIVMLDSWDDVPLVRNVASRKDSFRATNTHITIHGDITFSELQLEFKPRYLASGFANRLYFIVSVPRKRVDYDEMEDGELCVMDSRRPEIVAECARELRAAYDWLDSIQPMGPNGPALEGIEFSMGESCRPINREFKAAFNDIFEHDSLLNEALARGDSIVKRSAMIGAILDHTTTIEAKHLKAAIAEFWYAKASAERIFSYLAQPKDVNDSEALHTWALRHGRVSVRFATTSGPMATRKSETVTKIFNNLVKQGRGVWSPKIQNPKGGPPYREYIPHKN